MATTLRDLEALPRDPMSAGGLQEFRCLPRVQRLGWPEDVVRQWLFDHPSHFLRDYGDVDLETVAWSLEVVPTAMLVTLPTGASEEGLIEKFAADHEWHVRNRSHGGAHLGVPEMWETHGTWKTWPLLIERTLVDGGEGLQVVEGRTRVGVLRGRHRDGLRVADAHLCWVGRRRAH